MLGETRAQASSGSASLFIPFVRLQLLEKEREFLMLPDHRHFAGLYTAVIIFPSLVKKISSHLII